MDFKVNMAIESSGAVILSVEGELDIGSAERLILPTENAISAACPLVLDLSQCPLIDSSGLRLVLHTHHALSDVGARLAIVTDRPRTRRLLSVAGIDHRVPIFPTLDEAIAWIGSEGERMSDPVRPSVRLEDGTGSPATAPRDPLGGLSFRRLTASNNRRQVR
jgi:anti-anti-sigma factor